MNQKGYAVLIGNSTFPGEQKLQPLLYPENDVDGVNELLTSKEHGVFTSTFVLKNRPCQEVRERVNEVLNLADRDDLVLVYYAGHGKLNRLGSLHLATVDTRLSTLEATSFPVSVLSEYIKVSRSKRIVVVLDCCYSGAGGKELMRGSSDDSLQQFVSGSGIHVLTASTGIQVSLEREKDGHGIFTKHLLEGIRGGAADLNGDGRIGIDELYRYVHDHLREDGSQEPTLWQADIKGELIIARSGRSGRLERHDQIKAQLFSLVQEGIVTGPMFGQALPLLDLPPDQIAELQREQLDLLYRWQDKKLRVGELIESWTRLLAAPPWSTGSPTTISPPRVPAPPVPKGETALSAGVNPRPEPSATKVPKALSKKLREALERGLDGRLGLSLLLAAVLMVNLIETKAETWASGSELGNLLASWGNDFAWASQRFESWLSLDQGLSFLDHDAVPMFSVRAFSTSYFFLFPALCLAVAFILARRREISPFRVYSLALAADYALSLPFFLLLPIPERWAYPDSGAILLSDRWYSQLIDALRPMSGLDNCFPSFHVSMTVVAILVCFRFGVQLRVAALCLGLTVVLSTLVLGIHWLADIVAGVAVGTFSLGLGVYLDARLACRCRETVGETLAQQSSSSA